MDNSPKILAKTEFKYKGFCKIIVFLLFMGGIIYILWKSGFNFNPGHNLQPEQTDSYVFQILYYIFQSFPGLLTILGLILISYLIYGLVNIIFGDQVLLKPFPPSFSEAWELKELRLQNERLTQEFANSMIEQREVLIHEILTFTFISNLYFYQINPDYFLDNTTLIKSLLDQLSITLDTLFDNWKGSLICIGQETYIYDLKPSKLPPDLINLVENIYNHEEHDYYSFEEDHTYILRLITLDTEETLASLVIITDDEDGLTDIKMSLLTPILQAWTLLFYGRNIKMEEFDQIIQSL